MQLLPVGFNFTKLFIEFFSLLYLQPELTVENLPSFLTLGKALLLLFVGEEEDEIGRRQNKALVEEMRGVVEFGGERMERYLACWIHLYVHQSILSISPPVKTFFAHSFLI